MTGKAVHHYSMRDHLLTPASYLGIELMGTEMLVLRRVLGRAVESTDTKCELQWELEKETYNGQGENWD